jgi:hypothetical protein
MPFQMPVERATPALDGREGRTPSTLIEAFGHYFFRNDERASAN